MRVGSLRSLGRQEVQGGRNSIHLLGAGQRVGRTGLACWLGGEQAADGICT